MLASVASGGERAECPSLHSLFRIDGSPCAVANVLLRALGAVHVLTISTLYVYGCVQGDTIDILESSTPPIPNEVLPKLFGLWRESMLSLAGYVDTKTMKAPELSQVAFGKHFD